MYFCFFCNYLPWEKGGALHLNKLESLHPRILCAKFGWNWLSGSGEEDFLILSLFFPYFCNYLPWEKGGALHLNKLESLHPRILCAKLGRNWPSGSGEVDENVKSLGQRKRQRQQRQRRTTDTFRSEKLTWAFGSGELKTRKYNTKPSKFLYHF